MFALRSAALAMSTEGIGGALVVKVPRKLSAGAEVQFTTGPASIQLEF